MAPPPQAPERSLEACASTASLFLYAQGSTILCLHHDTLALDRRFENHQEDIAFISVDNVSERGQGRLVVSYDVGQTAIVWDLFTGTEIARFAAFEPLKVASWMRNGSVAFGIFFLCLGWCDGSDNGQGIRKGRLSFSSRRLRNTSRLGLFLSLLRHWRRVLIVGHMQLGMFLFLNEEGMFF